MNNQMQRNNIQTPTNINQNKNANFEADGPYSHQTQQPENVKPPSFNNVNIWGQMQTDSPLSTAGSSLKVSNLGADFNLP